jgi:hypothetical protein
MNGQAVKDQTSPSKTLPDGAAWAALLAAGIGCAAFGVLTVLSECIPAVSKALLWYVPSGSLSGVAIASIAIWLVAWAILAMSWKDRSVRKERRLMVLSLLLVLLGILLTFPPFYGLFEKH